MIKWIKGVRINTKSNVREYSDEEVFEIFKSLPEFTHFPTGDWFFWIRSKERQSDVMGCKCFHYRSKEFIRTILGTTISGKWGTQHFDKYNKHGVAVIKGDQIMYDSFMKTDGKKVRHHRGRMKAFRQIKEILYHRDGDKDLVVEENGREIRANNSTNFHCNSYKYFNGIISWFIGKWSLGCMVANTLTEYYKSYNEVPFNEPITIAIHNEK